MWRALVAIGFSAWLLGGCESAPLSDPEAGCGVLGIVLQPLSGACMQKQLQPVADPERDDYGQVPCRIATVGVVGSEACDCAASGFLPADAALADFARSRLKELGHCQDACCDDYCFCELAQLSGADLDYCWNVETEPRHFNELPVGWCYVEPDAGFGDPELVAECRANARHLIRLVPVRAAWNVVLACQG